MKALGYVIESNGRSLQPITHFKIHRYHPRAKIRHLVWWRFSVMYGPVQYCEECETETGLEAFCQDCFERHFCECGQRLEDSWGSPGDGFCARCR